MPRIPIPPRQNCNTYCDNTKEDIKLKILEEKITEKLDAAVSTLVPKDIANKILEVATISTDASYLYVDADGISKKITMPALLALAKAIKFKKVDELPQFGDLNIIYLMPSEHTEDFYTCDEYIFTDNNWEKIGSTAVNLNDYAEKTITVTGTNGLIGGGDLSQNRSIAHAIPEGAEETELGAYKIKTDKFGHITGKEDLALKKSATHTHTISGTGIVDMAVASPVSKKLKAQTSKITALTSILPVTKKLDTTNILNISDTTRASAATVIGTDLAIGNATIGEAAQVAVNAVESNSSVYDIKFNEAAHSLVLSPVTLKTEAISQPELSTNKLANYVTFEDVAVPIADEEITVATGELSNTALGAEVVIGVSQDGSAEVVNDIALVSTDITSTDPDAIDYTETITSTAIPTPVVLSGGTGAAGAHTHELS